MKLAVITWLEEDLKEALRQEGFEPSEENMDKVKDEGLEKALEEQGIAAGWEAMYCCIRTAETLERSKT